MTSPPLSLEPFSRHAERHPLLPLVGRRVSAEATLTARRKSIGVGYDAQTLLLDVTVAGDVRLRHLWVHLPPRALRLDAGTRIRLRGVVACYRRRDGSDDVGLWGVSLGA